MKNLKEITLFFLLLAATGNCYSQDEESLKEQSLDDIEALSSKDFPYIERFHEAVREKLSGNFEEAKKLFKSCLKEKANDDAVHFGLAEIAKKQNQSKVAQDHFERAYSIDKGNIVYLQELAYLSYDHGQFEVAAEYYEKLVERQPRNVDWIYGYSQVLIYNKRYEDAATMLEKLQDQVGIVPEIMMMKADLYQEINQPQKSEQTLLDLCKEYPENREALETLLSYYEKNDMPEKANQMIVDLASSNPDNMLIQMKLAAIYAESGDQKKLMESLKTIIQSDEVEVADKIYQLEQLLNHFQVEKTQLLDLTSMLIDSNGDDPRAALLHAEVLTQNNRSKEALSFYRESLSESGDQFEIWVTVLGFESAYNDYQALYEDGQKALSYFPNMPFIYYAAAEGAIYTDKPEEALDILDAGQIYLLDDNKQKARFAMRKGEAYFQMEEYKKGIKQFETALSINDEAQIRIKYAYLLSSAEIALSIAKEQLDKVKEEDQTGSYYLAKTEFHIAKKEFSKAEEMLLSGLDKVSYGAVLLDRLGDVKMLQDDLDNAIHYWKKAKEQGSRNKAIDQKIKEEKLYAPTY